MSLPLVAIAGILCMELSPLIAWAGSTQDAEYWLEEFIGRTGERQGDAEEVLKSLPDEVAVNVLSKGILEDARFQEPKLRSRAFRLLKVHKAYRFESGIRALLAGLDQRSSIILSTQMLQHFSEDRYLEAAEAIAERLTTCSRDVGVVASLSQTLGSYGGASRTALAKLRVLAKDVELARLDRREVIAAIAQVDIIDSVMVFYSALDEEGKGFAVIGLARAAMAQGHSFEGDSGINVRVREFVLSTLESPSPDVCRAGLEGIRIVFGAELFYVDNGQTVLSPKVIVALDRAAKAHESTALASVIEDHRRQLEISASSNTKQR